MTSPDAAAVSRGLWAEKIAAARSVALLKKRDGILLFCVSRMREGVPLGNVPQFVD